MQRILPETDLEKKLLSLGAVFIEENCVLDELFQVVGSDLLSETELAPEIQEQVLNEIGEYFFRLDMNYGPEIKPDCIAILNDYWKVFDRQSCLQNLQDIRQQGHRTKFNVLKASLPKDKPLDAGSLEKFKQIFSFDFDEEHQLGMDEGEYKKLAAWFQRTEGHLGECSILAWDAARYIHLARLSFMAGYLTDVDAWAEILKLAPLIEGKFQNWMEFSKSFLIGRTFWSGSDDPEVKAICERLLGHPASPWQFVQLTD